MSEAKNKYLEEYEKWKHVVITPGLYRQRLTNNNYLILYEVLSVEGEEVALKNPNSGFLKTKTLHWARKNLEPYTKS
jgi:hypothetical protein